MLTRSNANITNGTYAGPIIGQTDHHLIQRLNKSAEVLHPKNLLPKPPSIGDDVRISYRAQTPSITQNVTQKQGLHRGIRV